MLAAASRRLIRHRTAARTIAIALPAAAVVVVASQNYLIVRDFQRLAAQKGDPIGDSIRFEEQHASENATWIYSPGISGGYIDAGVASDWSYWLSFGVGPLQTMHVLEPGQLSGSAAQALGTSRGYLLTTSGTWHYVSPQFTQRWKVTGIHKLNPMGQRVAVAYEAR